MIPSGVAKRIVSRFEKAVTTRAQARAAGQLDHAITFEYRQSKRELLALIHLLRTGENPDNSMEDRISLIPQPIRVSPITNEPKEPSPR